MPQSQFTVAEADGALEHLKAILDVVPRSKKAELMGPANELFLFLGRAKQMAKMLEDARSEEG